MAGIDVTRGLELLLGKNEQKTAIRCSVMDFQARQGLLAEKTFFIDTTDVLSGRGDINLQNERLNLELKGDPKHIRFSRLRSPITIPQAVTQGFADTKRSLGPTQTYAFDYFHPCRANRTLHALASSWEMTMENSIVGGAAKTSQALANKAGENVKEAVHSAQKSVKNAGSSLSSMGTDLQDVANPLISEASDRAQSAARQGFDAISDIADRARDMAGSTADSIVNYTKKNPVTALAIAAAAGVVLYGAIRGLRSYRD